MGTHTSDCLDVQAILDAVRHVVQALRESSRLAERQVGLTGAQLFVLQKLAESPALSVNELAERTHTHQSSVSTVVSRLVDRRLVRRARAADDARRVRLSLTARGTQVAGRAPDLAQERLILGIERLPAARRRELARTLSALAEAVRPTSRAPVMFFEDAKRSKPRGEKRRA